MAATPDRIINETTLLEIKTHDIRLKSRYGDEGSADVMLYEWVQAQHQMAVTGTDRVVFGVLFGPNEALSILAKMVDAGATIEAAADIASDNLTYCEYTVPRDDAFIKDLIHDEKQFWERYCIGDEMPDDLERLEPIKNIRTATAEEANLIAELKDAAINKKRYTAKYDDLKACIGIQIGKDEGIESEDGKVTYRKPADQVKEVTDWESIAVATLEKSTLTDTEWADLVEANTKEIVTEKKRTVRVPTSWTKGV